MERKGRVATATQQQIPGASDLLRLHTLYTTLRYHFRCTIDTLATTTVFLLYVLPACSPFLKPLPLPTQHESNPLLIDLPFGKLTHLQGPGSAQEPGGWWRAGDAAGGGGVGHPGAAAAERARLRSAATGAAAALEPVLQHARARHVAGHAVSEERGASAHHHTGQGRGRCAACALHRLLHHTGIRKIAAGATS